MNKKLLASLALVATLTLASCNKEEQVTPVDTPVDTTIPTDTTVTPTPVDPAMPTDTTVAQ